MAHRQIKGKRKGLEIFNIGDKEYYKLYDTVIVIRDMVAGAYNRPRKQELCPLKSMTCPLQNLNLRSLLAVFVLRVFISGKPS